MVTFRCFCSFISFTGAKLSLSYIARTVFYTNFKYSNSRKKFRISFINKSRISIDTRGLQQCQQLLSAIRSMFVETPLSHRMVKILRVIKLFLFILVPKIPNRPNATPVPNIIPNNRHQKHRKIYQTPFRVTHCTDPAYSLYKL